MRTMRPGGSCSASSATATASRWSASAGASSPARWTGPLLRRRRQPAPDRTERLRLLRPGGERAERPLPEADAAPFAEFEADLLVDSDLPEAEPFVQHHAGMIGQGDRRNRLGKTLRLEHRQQGPVELRANTAALGAIGQVDSGLNAEPIGRPAPEGGGIGIAKDSIVAVARDQP